MPVYNRKPATGRVARTRVTAVARVKPSALLRAAPNVEPIVGVQNFSAANYLMTQTGGGEAGTAGGFGFVEMFRLDKLPSVNSELFARDGISLATGWRCFISSSNGLTGRFYSGAGAAIVQSGYVFTSADVGRVFVIIGQNAATTTRLWCSKLVSPDVAITGYTPAASPMAVGVDSGLQNPNGSVTYIASATFTGIPTSAQVSDYFDAARKLGDLPTTFTGATVTHHHSVKLELAKQTDQTAPRQLADTITAASVDTLAAVGNGLQTVKIDPSIDGRKTYGAQGFSDASYFRTAVGKGVQGSTAGFTCTMRLRWDSIPSGLQIPMIAGIPGSAPVWFLRTNGAALNVSANAQSSSYTITAADIGPWVTVQVVFTGAAIRLFVRGVQVGADVACTLTPQGSAVFFFGGWTSQPFTAGAIQGACGGNYVATAGELAQQAADIEAAGRIVAIPGLNGATAKTEHLYDLTVDILASGVETVPATVLDRIGSDNLTRMGIDVRTDANAIRSVGPYGVTDGWQTAPGGGVQGSNTFHVVIDFVLTKVPTASEMLLHATNSGTTTGWFAQFASNLFRVVISGGVAISPNYTVTSADLNKRLRLVINKTSAVLQVAINGVAAFADTTATAFNSNTSLPMFVGAFFGAQAFGSGYVELIEGSNTAALTAGEMAALAADLTQAAPIVAGKTSKRFVFESDITAASGTLPAVSVERISGNDSLARLGAPLVLAQRVERTYSYETTPILYGANAYTDADYFTALNVFPGNPWAWWWVLPFVLESQAVTSATRILIGQETSPSGGGWDIRTTVTNTLITPTIVDGGGTARLGTAITLNASDIGKTLLFGLCWDGQKLHSFLRRLESGTGATLAVPGYTPAATGSGFFLGRYPLSTGLSATGIRTLGAGMGGAGVLTLAEYQTAHDAFLASDDLVRVPGKTDFYNSLKQDVAANGGAMPTTLTDRIGGKNLTKVGSPALVPMYARAAGW